MNVFPMVGLMSCILFQNYMTQWTICAKCQRKNASGAKVTASTARDIACDDVFTLCTYIMAQNNLRVPLDAYTAIDLYLSLRTELTTLLNTSEYGHAVQNIDIV
ncbi:hypothetical protein AMELA_G00216610 [Ameiurus melas]|uniref:Uncharacterized protein n=1 Tax=Ameiurus melas TaxID=219545 RepID=A0A7J6A119_AMEME|nr:hypothetical protein AMELA_G00216610 [Ameiurus melas]